MPQPPERCLSRKAGIVRYCRKYKVILSLAPQRQKCLLCLLSIAFFALLEELGMMKLNTLRTRLDGLVIFRGILQANIVPAFRAMRCV